MFEEPRYIQNSFSIAFHRDIGIRRRANQFEDLLREKFEGHYGQPQIIPIPDEIDPEVPRMIFGSRHGFSQIIVSQISMTLNVTYSPDWQTDILKGKDYLQKRTVALFSLLKALGDVPAFFSGLITRARLYTNIQEMNFLQLIRDRINFNFVTDPVHDVMFKETTVSQEKFFSNITIQNFRGWNNQQAIQEIPRFARNTAIEHGIEIVGDFNDRYAYNESKDYYSSSEVGQNIIDLGLVKLDLVINKLRSLPNE
jgi:hypothetical protein